LDAGLAADPLPQGALCLAFSEAPDLSPLLGDDPVPVTGVVRPVVVLSLIQSKEWLLTLPTTWEMRLLSMSREVAKNVEPG
jgi:hypothetical protein